MAFPVVTQDGSSPLARGLPSESILCTIRGRIIPARAGFTRALANIHLPSKDHPRSRGVYPYGRSEITPSSGSSPLARGLPEAAINENGDIGIIPARAGFTRNAYAYPLLITGSSPLARGLPEYAEHKAVRPRIIPARAGFTQGIPRGYLDREDHPRSRGVYLDRDWWHAEDEGSSPLARGLPQENGNNNNPGGIIPARAGFTLADPWNPNEPVLYQTPVAFTADLGPAPPSCGSAAVVLRWTTTPSGA